MIGTRLTDGDDVFEVVGAQAGVYVLQQLTGDFSPPFQTTVAELAQRFKVDVSEPEQGDELEGWKRLAAAHEAARVAVPGVEPLRPETVFAAASGDKSAAQAVAQDIAADPAKIAAWKAGHLTVHRAVDRDLRKLLDA